MFQNFGNNRWFEPNWGDVQHPIPVQIICEYGMGVYKIMPFFVIRMLKL